MKTLEIDEENYDPRAEWISLLMIELGMPDESAIHDLPPNEAKRFASMLEVIYSADQMFPEDIKDLVQHQDEYFERNENEVVETVPITPEDLKEAPLSSQFPKCGTYQLSRFERFMTGFAFALPPAYREDGKQNIIDLIGSMKDDKLSKIEMRLFLLLNLANLIWYAIHMNLEEYFASRKTKN